MLFDGGLHAVIAGGQNVGMAQGEHEEHVRGPDADAFDLGEVGDDFFFRHLSHALELQHSGSGLLGKIAEIGRFLAREANDTHFGIREFENALRRQRVAGARGEAVKDSGGSFAVQLLIQDRLGQRVKRGLTKLHAAGSDALDDCGESGIGLLEVIDCFLVTIRFGQILPPRIDRLT